jgi:hypothetical protein
VRKTAKPQRGDIYKETVANNITMTCHASVDASHDEWGRILLQNLVIRNPNTVSYSSHVLCDSRSVWKAINTWTCHCGAKAATRVTQITFWWFAQQQWIFKLGDVLDIGDFQDGCQRATTRTSCAHGTRPTSTLKERSDTGTLPNLPFSENVASTEDVFSPSLVRA